MVGVGAYITRARTYKDKANLYKPAQKTEEKIAFRQDLNYFRHGI